MARALIVHVWAMSTASLIGLGILLTRKGSPVHRRLGRGFAVAALVGAVTTFGIRSVNGGALSLDHAFALVVAGLALAQTAWARLRWRRMHRVLGALALVMLFYGTVDTFIGPLRPWGVWTWHHGGIALARLIDRPPPPEAAQVAELRRQRQHHCP